MDDRYYSNQPGPPANPLEPVDDGYYSGEEPPADRPGAMDDGYYSSEPEPPDNPLDARRLAAILGGVFVVLITAVALSLIFLSNPNDGSVGALTSPSPSAAASLPASPTAPEVTATPTIIIVTPEPSASPPPTQAPTASPGPDDELKTAPPTTPPPTLAPGQPSPTPAPTPPGDDMRQPIVITSLPAAVTGDTTHATTSPSDPDCYGTGPTIWLSFTPSRSMTVVATTFGSNYDTTLHAGIRQGVGTYDEIACNDDAGDSLQSALRLDLRAGVTYLFMAGSYGGWERGLLVFNLQAAEPPPTISLTIEPQGTFDELGRATLRGTAICSSRVDNLYVEVSLRQRVGRQIFRGEGDTVLARCSSRVRDWTVVVTSYDGTFGDEPATARAYASFCDEFDCSYTEIEQAVTLSSSVPPATPSPTPVPPATPSPTPSSEPDEAPVEEIE